MGVKETAAQMQAFASLAAALGLLPLYVSPSLCLSWSEVSYCRLHYSIFPSVEKVRQDTNIPYIVSHL
jgi:hypothetical protein